MIKNQAFEELRNEQLKKLKKQAEERLKIINSSIKSIKSANEIYRGKLYTFDGKNNEGTIVKIVDDTNDFFIKHLLIGYNGCIDELAFGETTISPTVTFNIEQFYKSIKVPKIEKLDERMEEGKYNIYFSNEIDKVKEICVTRLENEKTFIYEHVKHLQQNFFIDWHSKLERYGILELFKDEMYDIKYTSFCTNENTVISNIKIENLFNEIVKKGNFDDYLKISIKPTGLETEDYVDFVSFEHKLEIKFMKELPQIKEELINSLEELKYLEYKKAQKVGEINI